ncbi:hypothetical protein Y1Q_0006571 [Alligator mississippiensis]|uniref:Uncharacterized protein n=1 Tax=Alligator mississippiensis TaxID=8496 RepID=A0A151NTC9_ALLMI|nr:hypothetical protein Y1Q_0006571 [Alligator mississippiensis]
MWMYMHMATRCNGESRTTEKAEPYLTNRISFLFVIESSRWFPEQEQDILHFCSSGNDDEKCKCNVFKADGKTSGLNKGTYRHRSLLPMTVFHGMTSGKLPHHVYKSSIIK